MGYYEYYYAIICFCFSISVKFFASDAICSCLIFISTYIVAIFIL